MRDGRSDDGPGVAAADQRPESAGEVSCRVSPRRWRPGRAPRRRTSAARPGGRCRWATVEVAGVGEPRDGERHRGVGVVGVVDDSESSATSTSAGRPDDLDAAGRGVADQALGAVPARAPKRTGSPWTSGMIASALVSLSLIASNAPSLKIGQFWSISTSAVPRWAAAAESTSVRCLRSESTVRATNEALGAERQRDRVERVVDRSNRRRLGDLAGLGGRGVLPLGEPVDPVVEQQDGDVHVAAQRVDGGCRRSTARCRRRRRPRPTDPRGRWRCRWR